MTDVRVYRKSDGSIRLKMEGHAGTAPKGEDLLCAAASQCAYTIAQAVTFYHEMGYLQLEPKVEITDGKATVIATPKREYLAEVLNSFWTVQCGLHVLSHNYPQHIRLTEHL